MSHHFQKIGGHQPRRRGDILFLICHMSSCDHEVRGHVTLVSFPQYKSPWSQAMLKRRNFAFCFSRDLTWRCSQRVMWHYEWVSLIISDYSAKFGDYRPFGREDIIFSICHVTSRDHVVVGSCDILCEFFS